MIIRLIFLDNGADYVLIDEGQVASQAREIFLTKNHVLLLKL
jgi:hypothetical protein